jgi:hypothetical protein
MSGQLTRYDAARAALTAAVRVDEVKSIRDEADRMKLYAKQSKDKTMMADAAALKDRATRRLGELIEVQRKTVGLSEGGRPRKTGVSKTPDITLAEIGVDKNLAKQARKFAALPEEKFEALIVRRAEAAALLWGAGSTSVRLRTMPRRSSLHLSLHQKFSDRIDSIPRPSLIDYLGGIRPQQ